MDGEHRDDNGSNVQILRNMELLHPSVTTSAAKNKTDTQKSPSSRHHKHHGYKLIIIKEIRKS